MAPSILTRKSASEIAALIRAGEVSSTEITKACLERIESLNDKYHVYVTILRNEAIHSAMEADAAVHDKRPLGPLHGVPVNVKDVFLMTGTPTTIGSKLLHNYMAPSEKEAACVQRLRNAGAVILGTVNVGGGGFLDQQSDSRMTAPCNPWQPSCTPGGSSSGSAVSVALGMGYASVGTDSGGSIREPAALSGVVGLKPTNGLVSRRGDIYGLSKRLVCVGPLTRTVNDAALLLSVLAGFESDDPTSRMTHIPDYTNTQSKLEINKLQIGWVSDGGPLGAEPDVLSSNEKAINILSRTGIKITETRLPPFSDELFRQIHLLYEWEAYDAEVEESRPYLSFINDKLRINRRALLARAELETKKLREAYEKLFAQFDILALPTTPIVAKPFQVTSLRWREIDRTVPDLYLLNEWMFNVTGNPAISLPCGFSTDKLPIGLQLVGRHFEESKLFAIGRTFEESMGGFPLPPI